MNKNEALNYIRLCKGYIPYVSLFEIYNDDDIIPQELIDMSIREDNLKGYFMVCSAKFSEEIKKLSIGY